MGAASSAGGSRGSLARKALSASISLATAAIPKLGAPIALGCVESAEQLRNRGDWQRWAEVAHATKDEMSRKRETWFVLAMLIVGTLGLVTLVTEPTHASINCRFVSCACPDCLEGEHLEVPPGQCCPVCVPD